MSFIRVRKAADRKFATIAVEAIASVEDVHGRISETATEESDFTIVALKTGVAFAIDESQNKVANLLTEAGEVVAK